MSKTWRRPVDKWTWCNWYWSRRRLDFDGPYMAKQLRQLSWRRAK